MVLGGNVNGFSWTVVIIKYNNNIIIPHSQSIPIHQSYKRPIRENRKGVNYIYHHSTLYTSYAVTSSVILKNLHVWLGNWVIDYPHVSDRRM